MMIRGAFADIRLRNQLAPGTEGGWTRHQPSGEEMSIFDAAEKYKAEGVPLVVLGGAEYGTGSSRDWAAKGWLLRRRVGRRWSSSVWRGWILRMRWSTTGMGGFCSMCCGIS